ncbi:hypothetical protein [Yinghuangia soli]|uniref:Uncharacterized protein n=1 Tax=Yinghuangia soli TaxID=2908204 RepID=A0AA41PZM9_9ACTN|nr:hypothetical protein [Yinghuangia soli]MCF2528859.1 hypothetical protein [Yinghuangia soli]
MSVEVDGIDLVPGPSRHTVDAALVSSTVVSAEARKGQTAGQRLDWGRRVAVYEADLASGYRRLPLGSVPGRPRPRHPVTVDGRTVDVVYDATLDQQVLRLYTGHGWAGVQALQAGLDAAAEEFPSRVLHPWDVVREFAEYAVAGLWARVRAALVEIDLRATEDLVVQLNLSANLVNAAWTALGVEPSNRDEHGQRRHPSPGAWWQPTPAFYRLTKPEPLRRLMESMPDAVALRRRLGEIKLRREHNADALAWGGEEFSAVNSPGDATTALRITELDAEAVQVSAELEELLKRIHAVTPLAAMAVATVQEPVTEWKVQQAVGAHIAVFRSEPERIVGDLPRHGGWVAKALPDWAPDRPAPAEYAARSPEVRVLDVALTQKGGSARCLSMLAEPVLDRLVTTGTVPKDSFTYVVWSHYRRQLMRRLAAEQRTRELAEELLSLLAKAAAVLSFVVLKVPSGSWLTALAGYLNVGLLAFQCFAVLDQLDRIDARLTMAVAAVDRRSASEIAHIGELLSMRTDFREQLTASVVLEIALITAAGAWPPFRELMHVRGFYSDLETLLEP